MAEYASLRKIEFELCGGNLPEKYKTFVRRVLNDRNLIPAAEVAPVVHGRWIEDHDYLKCPECGVMVKWDFTFFDIGNWNYCPNCGAKMDMKEQADV